MTEKDIKITMLYYGCSREDAVQTLEDGNNEALVEYEDRCAEDLERDYYASEVN